MLLQQIFNLFQLILQISGLIFQKCFFLFRTIEHWSDRKSMAHPVESSATAIAHAASIIGVARITGAGAKRSSRPLALAHQTCSIFSWHIMFLLSYWFHDASFTHHFGSALWTNNLTARLRRRMGHPLAAVWTNAFSSRSGKVLLSGCASTASTHATGIAARPCSIFSWHLDHLHFRSMHSLRLHGLQNYY